MKTVKFSYANTTQDLQVPDDTPVLTSKVEQLTSDRTGLDIVREAMENPIDSPRLSELAKGKDNCVIIISDHTRPVPSKDILPNMIRELREGSPDIKIKLLVATGFHRPTSIEELKNKLGDALYEEFKDDIVVHDAHDPSRNVKVGSLPSGPDCIIDKLAMETQLLVAEGFIEPHFFAVAWTALVFFHLLASPKKCLFIQALVPTVLNSKHHRYFYLHRNQHLRVHKRLPCDFAPVQEATAIPHRA